MQNNKRYKVLKDHTTIANGMVCQGETVFLISGPTKTPITMRAECLVQRANGSEVTIPAEYLEPISKMESTSDDRTINNVMRHQYRVLSDEEKEQMRVVKDMGLDFHEYIANIGDSRELSLAKTKVEEAVMWAVKHITG